MKSHGEVFVEQIKLTLHRKADAGVIALIQAMPYGLKARLIAEALLMAYRVGPDGDIELVSQSMDKPSQSGGIATPITPIESQPEPPKRIKVKAEAF